MPIYPSYEALLRGRLSHDPCHFAPFPAVQNAAEPSPETRVLRLLRRSPAPPYHYQTQAYAVLSDPKKKEAYDRDGHPPSKSNKASSAAPTKVPSAPPAPQPPTAPSAQSYPSAPSQQGYGGGWGGDGGGGGWQGMSMAGGYGQGWVSLR